MEGDVKEGRNAEGKGKVKEVRRHGGELKKRTMKAERKKMLDKEMK